MHAIKSILQVLSQKFFHQGKREKNLKMEQIRELPTEMKHYILSFIGREDMQHVKLVNRDFYSRCSAILNKEKSSLTIDLEKVKNPLITAFKMLKLNIKSC